MVNFSSLTAEICCRVFGTPANLNGFRLLAVLLHRRRLTEVNQTLHDVWYTIYAFVGALAPNRVLPGAKFTLCPSLTFSYIGTVTARHLSSWHQPNFAALNRGRHLHLAGRPSGWALAHISSSSIFFFFSSPNLSGRRLDVCHTSTHGVTLVQI